MNIYWKPDQKGCNLRLAENEDDLKEKYPEFYALPNGYGHNGAFVGKVEQKSDIRFDVIHVYLESEDVLVVGDYHNSYGVRYHLVNDLPAGVEDGGVYRNAIWYKA